MRIKKKKYGAHMTCAACVLLISADADRYTHNHIDAPDDAARPCAPAPAAPPLPAGKPLRLCAAPSDPLPPPRLPRLTAAPASAEELIASLPS
jgi:hypothetical protein